MPLPTLYEVPLELQFMFGSVSFFFLDFIKRYSLPVLLKRKVYRSTLRSILLFNIVGFACVVSQNSNEWLNQKAHCVLFICG